MIFRGQDVPCFIIKMIDKAKIKYFLDEILEEMDLFLVDLNVRPSNKILIEIDSVRGVSIDECAMVSTRLESKLNRNVEDFELEISSPGLGMPFKVFQQYEKNIGNQVSVLMKDGTKFTGKLVDASPSGIRVEMKEKVMVEGRKKPELVTVTKELLFNEIKLTKAIINF